jgi:hypothetical protein
MEDYMAYQGEIYQIEFYYTEKGRCQRFYEEATKTAKSRKRERIEVQAGLHIA